MRRIVIVGCGGAGKSTLARQLGATLDLPVVHLDSHFWRPGWVETPHEEWKGVLEGLLEEDAWVMDGNYGRTLDMRFARADTILFLDFPRLVCLANVARRWKRYYGRSRPDLAPDCPERVSLDFVRWIWAFKDHSRPTIVETLPRYAKGRRVEIFYRRRELTAFLADVAARRA